MGGPLFMGMLTVVLAAILALAIVQFILVTRKDYKSKEETRKRLTYLKSFGAFAVVLGFLGQMIGLFAAFEAIEGAMDISPAILAGGLKVSIIAPIYGMVIFLISYILWFAVDSILSRQ